MPPGQRPDRGRSRASASAARSLERPIENVEHKLVLDRCRAEAPEIRWRVQRFFFQKKKPGPKARQCVAVRSSQFEVALPGPPRRPAVAAGGAVVVPLAVPVAVFVTLAERVTIAELVGVARDVVPVVAVIARAILALADRVEAAPIASVVEPSLVAVREAGLERRVVGLIAAASARASVGPWRRTTGAGPPSAVRVPGRTVDAAVAVATVTVVRTIPAVAITASALESEAEVAAPSFA